MHREVRHNDGVFIAGNALAFPEQREMTALDLEGSRGTVAGNAFAGAAAVMKDAAVLTLLSNNTGADAESLPIEWKRISGGFASRVALPDGAVIALMRGGPTTVACPSKLEAYGHSTTADFAWFHGPKKVVRSRFKTRSTWTNDGLSRTNHDPHQWAPRHARFD